MSGGGRLPLRVTERIKVGMNSRKLELGLVLLLLSYPIVKFSSYPMSEMQYLFFSCGSLYFFRLYTDRGSRPAALALAFMFAGLATLTRTVGIALLPALMAGLAWHHRVVLMRYWKILVPAVVVMAAGMAMVVGMSSNLYMSSVRLAGPGWMALLREHLMEWGQLMLNVPMGKMAGIGERVVRWLMIAIGSFLVCLVSYQLMRQRKKIPLAAGIYLALYCLLIFCWPFFDVRFWIPVAPLMIMILLQGKYPRFFRLMVFVYMLAGMGALGYSAYTAFNRQALARNQAGGRYRNEYEIFFFGKPSPDTAVRVDPYVLHVLETCK
jgi:hypothetical protein